MEFNINNLNNNANNINKIPINNGFISNGRKIISNNNSTDFINNRYNNINDQNFINNNININRNNNEFLSFENSKNNNNCNLNSNNNYDRNRINNSNYYSINNEMNNNNNITSRIDINSINVNNFVENNNNNYSKDLKSCKEFKFLFNNKIYKVKISITSNNQYLNIKSNEEGNSLYFYENQMSLIELTEFDKIFKTCDNIKDAFENMVKIFNIEHNSIQSIIDNKFILLLNILDLDGKFREKKLELKYNEDNLVENLWQQISELKVKNNNLNNELNEVKSENNNLKENYNSYKNDIIQEISKLKESLGKIENDSIPIDSNIIKNKEEFNFIIERLKKVKNNEDIKDLTDDGEIKIDFKLIYRASEDGDEAKDFHSKCDKYKNTLILVETKKKIRFGGFTTQTWEGNEIDKKDNKAFCFSLNKMKIYNSIKGQAAIFVSPNSGPAFENCIFEIKDKCFECGGMSSDDSNNYYDNQEIKCEINDGEEQFDVYDFEVFEVIF